MAVYVDDAFIQFGRMVCCHMFADTLEELHDMADKIGMRREWFQWHASFPHYDVASGRRRQAIALGAKPITVREGVPIRRRLRDDPVFMAAWIKEAEVYRGEA